MSFACDFFYFLLHIRMYICFVAVPVAVHFCTPPILPQEQQIDGDRRQGSPIVVNDDHLAEDFVLTRVADPTPEDS